MANSIIPFEFQSKQVRVLTINDEPWFVAKDVCDVLGLTDTSKSCERVKSDQKVRSSIPTPGGNQDMLCVSEAGLYKLIFCSRKAEAEVFQDWICEQVIPSIRKHGYYSIDENTVNSRRRLTDTVVDMELRKLEIQERIELRRLDIREKEIEVEMARVQLLKSPNAAKEAVKTTATKPKEGKLNTILRNVYTIALIDGCITVRDVYRKFRKIDGEPSNPENALTLLETLCDLGFGYMEGNRFIPRRF